MSITTARGQQKFITPLKGYTDQQSCDILEYVTGQNIGGRRRALDTIVTGLTSISEGNLVEAGSTQRIIKKTGHGAKANDVIQFTSGNNDGIAIQILSCPDADLMIIAANAEETIQVGDEFSIKRFVTPQYAADGSLVVQAQQGPLQFNVDGSPVTVNEDTGTPYLSVTLPVRRITWVQDRLFFNYKDTPADFNTFVELYTTVNDTKSLTLFDGSGQAIGVYTGAVGFEQPFFNIPPGGFNGEIPIPIPAGTRLSIKCLQEFDDDGNPIVANSGIMVANFIE